MTAFFFITDGKSQEYCELIANTMTEVLGISSSEAKERINKHWAGQNITGEDDLIYHEDEEYWANTIYYGKDSKWWDGTDGLTPIQL